MLDHHITAATPVAALNPAHHAQALKAFYFERLIQGNSIAARTVYNWLKRAGEGAQ